MQAPDSPISRERRRGVEAAGNYRIKTGLKNALLLVTLLLWLPLTLFILWLRN